MTSTPGCSLTSWVIVLNGRWSVPLGFTLAGIQGDLNVRSLTYFAFRLEDRCDGLGRRGKD